MCEGEGRCQLISVEPSLENEEAARGRSQWGWEQIPPLSLLKVTLPEWKPCPENFPLFLWGNEGNGKALGLGRDLCSEDEFFQQQCLFVGGYCFPFPGPYAGMPWIPLLLSKKSGSEEMVGLRSGHLLLQHQLWFFSILNASLPHLGAGKQKKRLQTFGWDL